MSTPDRLTKTQRRDEARAAALKLREQQQRVAKRQRTIAIGVGVGGVIVLAVLIWTILAQGNRSPLADVAVLPATPSAPTGMPPDRVEPAGRSATSARVEGWLPWARIVQISTASTMTPPTAAAIAMVRWRLATRCCSSRSLSAVARASSRRWVLVKRSGVDIGLPSGGSRGSGRVRCPATAASGVVAPGRQRR